MPLDPSDLAAHGPAFGCGVIGLLPGEACGVAATDRILGYMAEASARQCGPCVYGLDAIAAGLRRLSRGTPTGGELANLGRWSESIPGRGACHHPDGAATLLRTALDVFAEEFEIHARDRRCSGDATVQERRSA
jgi:NADH:ubiquinone oxidoreductase subunit F (NADH-binding)